MKGRERKGGKERKGKEGKGREGKEKIVPQFIGHIARQGNRWWSENLYL